MTDKPVLFNREFQKEQSDKYKFKHIHTGEYCTFEAYVAELVVLRRAERLGMEKPSYKFWTKGDPNHWLWLKQLNAARALSKKYSEEAVLSFINSKDFNKFLLLGVQKGKGRGWEINQAIIPLVEKHQKIIEDNIEKQKNAPIIEVKENPEVRKAVHGSKKNILNKLRSLDG
jgi:hypothetical protein